MDKSIIPTMCGAFTFAIGSILFIIFMANDNTRMYFIVGLSCAFIGWFGRALFERFAI